jgi:hypothetical protein
MGNIVPASAQPILERTLDIVRIRANSNGECFGGQIMDALREAGTALGVDGLDLLLTRTVLVRTMESLGETYPAEVLQNYENRNANIRSNQIFARGDRLDRNASRTHLMRCSVGRITLHFVPWQTSSVWGVAARTG